MLCYAECMAAFIVRLAEDSPYGNKQGSVMVNAPDVNVAKERGASMLGVNVNQVTAVSYAGVTLGTEFPST